MADHIYWEWTNENIYTKSYMKHDDNINYCTKFNVEILFPGPKNMCKIMFVQLKLK